jgi:peptidoglycan/LPS O-acetylase OafA/YrhL
LTPSAAPALASSTDASASRPGARPEILALTSLRGLAAMWVLFYHLRKHTPALLPEAWPYLRPYSRSGHTGVDLFFVLSGFVIAYTYYESLRHFAWPKYVGFVRKRFARIYPAYFVMVWYAFGDHLWHLFGRGQLQGERVPKALRVLAGQLSMTHAWRFPIERQWNVVSWSVSAEWLAYLAFPAFVWLVARLRSATALLVAAAICVAAAGVTFHSLDDGGNMRVGLFRILYEFPLGMIAYRLYALDARPSRAWGLCAIVLLCGFGPFVRVFLRRHHIDGLVLTPVVFPFVVYGLARASQPWLGAPVLVWLGRVSYCLYLVHVEAIQLVGAFLPLDAVRPHGPVAAAGYLALNVACALLAAHTLHAWVERPWRQRLLRARR